MAENVKINSRSMRGLFFSPKSKISACPSFLIKNQNNGSLIKATSTSDSNKLSVQQFQPSSLKLISTSYESKKSQQLRLNSFNRNQSLQIPSTIRKVRKSDFQTKKDSEQNQEEEQNSETGTYDSTDGSPFQININKIIDNRDSTLLTPSSIRKTKSFLSKSGDHRLYSSINKNFSQLYLNLSLSEHGGSPRSLRGSKIGQQQNICLNDFQMIKQLGKGKTSSVYLAKYHPIGMLVAIKIISKEFIRAENLQQQIFRQIKLLSYIKHQNIIHLYKVFNDKNNVYMIFQYMGGGGNLFSLWKAQKTFNEKQTKKILVDVCNAVRYLHRNDIIHRDIKLQNILFMKGVAKLADLGCAVHSVYMRKSQVGSPSYFSPQQLNNGFYNKKIDVWSIGIMAYQMLFGFSPFNQEILKLLSNQKEMVSLNLQFPESPQVSQYAKDFISKLLVKNPNARFNIESALNHPFLQQTFKDHKKGF